MDKILAFLSGKKTYLVGAAAVGLGIVAYFGVVIPEWVWAIAGGLGLITLRAGSAKVKALVDELLKAQ